MKCHYVDIFIAGIPTPHEVYDFNQIEHLCREIIVVGTICDNFDSQNYDIGIILIQIFNLVFLPLQQTLL